MQAPKEVVARRRVVQGITCGLLLAPTISGADELPIEGTWTGILNAGSQRLRLRFVVESKQGRMFSVDQGGEPIPLDVISLAQDDVRLRIPAIRAEYRGRLLIAGDRIDGEWDQGMKIPLKLYRGEAGFQSGDAEITALDVRALQELRERSGAPALAAMVSLRSRSAEVWADGVRAIGSDVLVSENDTWHLGSITKSMTASLVARLVEARQISWDDTVGGLLGDKVTGIQKTFLDANFIHLLSHRAGLRRDIPHAELEGFSRDLSGPTRHERLRYASIALKQEPVGEPEETFEYSNNGYVVAAAMIEQKLNQDWEALVAQHVFEPLKIESAGFGAPGTRGKLLEPLGHVAKEPPVPQPIGEEVTDNPVALGPAGRVHMSLGDLARYLAAHRDRSGFLSADSWQTLHTPPFGGDYALGWQVRRDKTLWHGGSNSLWYAEVLIDESRGVACAAATNISSGKAAMAVGQALLRASVTR